MKSLLGGRIFLILIAVVVVGVGTFLIINREGGEEIFEKNMLVVDEGLSVLSNIDSDLDTDKDGLKDWQEALWQTDKNNPDTDGDGTSDGQEVKENRSPTNGGIEDILKLRDYKQTGSFTQQVSQNLYGQYSILRQEDSALSQDTQQALIENSLTNNDFSLDVNIYTFKDVRVNPQSTDYKKYADTMGKILITHSPKVGDLSVVEIIQNSLVASDQDMLSEIDATETRYARFIKDLLLVESPFTLAENHLLFINSLESTRASIAGLRDSATDPLKGVISLSIYGDSVETSSLIIADIRSFYEKNKITFEQGEAGYIFLYGL